MTQISQPNKNEIYYPESDGQPMAENTRQFDYIVLIKEGLEILFSAVLNIFIAGDLFWYPVEGHPEIVYAPDILVALGRPKGPRGSYQQWLEDNVAPQVVFEIISPSNSGPALERKRKFYEQYGVQEYYEYDPDRGELRGWLCPNNQMKPIATMRNWISPLLGIRFVLEGIELRIFDPNGQPFRMPVELSRIAEQEQQARKQAENARNQAEDALQVERKRVAELEALLKQLKPDLEI